MTPTAPAADRRREVLVFWTLALLSLLMTLKYFPGLENETAYAGNMFQAIYPDAFAGDPYIGPERSVLEKPLQFSIIYLLPRLGGGEIWLDDRFLAVVYLGLVFAALLGVDRIAGAAGLTDVPARLALQLLLMRDHQILENKVYLAHQPDINHKAFAIPVLVWLIYAAVARKGLWLILALAALAAAASIKSAPYVIAFSLFIAAVNGTRRERMVVAAVFVAALAAFYLAVTTVVAVPEENRVQLFDLIYRGLERPHANPFYPVPDLRTMLERNALLGAVLVAAVAFPGPRTEAMRNLRLFVALGIGLWLLAGLYYSFTPDALKLPQVIPFTVGRSLRWPQTVAYIALFIALVHWVRDIPELRRSIGFFIAIAVLTAIGPGNALQWFVLWVASLGMAMAIVTWRQASSHADPPSRRVSERLRATAIRSPVALGFFASAFAVLVAFSITISSRLPHWEHLVRTGIMGDTSSAVWIGVDDYLRHRTPPDTVVLPFRYSTRLADRLIAERGLATRGGRPLGVFEDYSSMFDLEGWRTEQAQRRLMLEIGELILRRDWPAAAEKIGLSAVVPDLVVVPASLVDGSASGPAPFEEQARVGAFSILRKKG